MGQGGSSSTSRSDDGVLVVVGLQRLWDVGLARLAVNYIAHLLIDMC